MMKVRDLYDLDVAVISPRNDKHFAASQSGKVGYLAFVLVALTGLAWIPPKSL
jgi:hypothetical protein